MFKKRSWKTFWNRRSGKKKLEDFLEQKKREITTQMHNKQSTETNKIVEKLEANTPANVTKLAKQVKNLEKQREQYNEKADKEMKKLQDQLKKEGYGFDYNETDVSINNVSERKEVKAIDQKHDKQRDKIEKIYEESILRVWTGSQSEAFTIVKEMVKAMEDLIK